MNSAYTSASHSNDYSPLSTSSSRSNGKRRLTSNRAPNGISLVKVLLLCFSFFTFVWFITLPHHNPERDTYSFDIPASRSAVLERLSNRIGNKEASGSGPRSPSKEGPSRYRGSPVTGNRYSDSFGPFSLSSPKMPKKSRPNLQYPEFNCNPFEELGRLVVDTEHVTKNVWLPYDRTCPSSNYMKDLYRTKDEKTPLYSLDDSQYDPKQEIASPYSSSKRRKFLPWLMNRTVLIHGDSIDRFHLKDFCDFVQGELTLIDPKHPASPPPYRSSNLLSPSTTTEQQREDRKTKEKFWEQRPAEGHMLTNPWVCDVKEYDFTLINVFTWGLEGAEEFFETERWYHPPATWNDRLDAITVPLLDNLARHFNRPQIRFPDLVELNSGYWDLRKYTEEDFVAAGWKTRPYPEDSPIPYQNLQPEREVTWEREARKAIKLAAKTFKGPDGKVASGPTLLWRSLHHPPRHNYAPYNRVFALDNLARKVVEDLQQNQPSTVPEIKEVEKAQRAKGNEEEDLNLGQRLRMDESGKLMLGQEQMFRDLLHPLPVPGSYLWANIMLYELKRAVKKIDRQPWY